jgi:uncharacterized protein YggU (UPF0235/DUF167 family)
MTQEIKNKILEAAKIVGAITIIQGGLIAIATPFVNEHIEQRIKDYHNSADFKLYVDGVIEEYRSQTTSTTSLRDLLSDKMGVPSDEVHIKLGEMYRHKGELDERIKEIIREIHYYHSDSILEE